MFSLSQILKDRDNGVTTPVELQGPMEAQLLAKQMIEDLVSTG
jgi:hypothetical protein